MTIAAVALLALLLGCQVVRIIQAAVTSEPRRAEVSNLPAPPVEVMKQLVKRRYVVTLPGQGGSFGAVLVDADLVTTLEGRPELVFTFDQCQTVPAGEGHTPETIEGRVILWSSGIAYLQQVG